MLTFIDESGYPSPTDSTRNPILLGVCIHENDIKPITDLYLKLQKLTENNFVQKSHFIEYGFQKMGNNFSYNVNENNWYILFNNNFSIDLL